MRGKTGEEQQGNYERAVHAKGCELTIPLKDNR
jgi:hypothetical protein